MKGFLLDTNIPSEMTGPSPQASVTGWLDDADDDQLHFSVVFVGEILKGVTLQKASAATSCNSGSTRHCGPGLKAASCR
jgi:predicted nucleic acid-binding protein